MLRTRFDFINDEGQTLSGRLEEPLDAVRGTVLFAHCFTCSKDLAAATRISRGLVDRGFSVLRFDFTGLGNSEGDFANTNFSSNVDDLRAAARALAEAGKAPQLLVGHSLGGAAVLSAAPDIESVKAVVAIAAPSTPDHLTHLLGGSLDEIRSQGEAEVELAGRRFRIKKQLLDDLDDQRLTERVRRMKRALLLLHSPHDELVSIEHARELFDSAKHPKSFVSLDDADHLLTRPADSQYAADVISSWAGRYLNEPPSRPEPKSEYVSVQSLPGFAQRIEVRGHVVRADEPRSVGGTDTGATPSELLLASLGACTSMTMKMYAQRKAWPLDHVEVELRHERIHKRDADQADGAKSRLSQRITKRIRIEGDLDDTQRARLLEIADRCPVHRTMKGDPEIVTELI